MTAQKLIRLLMKMKKDILLLLETAKRRHKILKPFHLILKSSHPVRFKFKLSIILSLGGQESLTVASISVKRVTKGSKLRISTTRWGRRSKVAEGAIKIFENGILNSR